MALDALTPNRVAAWRQDAPGLPQDEFIDNIPFNETQTYVKRILGTAEDYRRLYGTGVLDPNVRLVPVSVRNPKSEARSPDLGRRTSDPGTGRSWS